MISLGGDRIFENVFDNGVIDDRFSRIALPWSYPLHDAHEQSAWEIMGVAWSQGDASIASGNWFDVDGLGSIIER